MGVLAAPNQSRITANVLAVERSPDWPDKWLLEIEIVSSEDMEGPNFAMSGWRGPASVISSECAARPMCTIQADGEYVGGGRGGQWHLSNLSVLK